MASFELYRAKVQLCDQLGADDVERMFRRWLARLPHPFSRADRAAGYRYRLSVWQMELSITHVFDRPLNGRYFFEEVIRENLDLGRPDRVQLLFDRQVRLRGPNRTPGSFRTRVIQHGVTPKLSVEYKQSRVKPYFKEGRAQERTSHNGVIALRTFESVVLPSETDGQHAPGLRFGDPRVMALLAALCLFLPAPDGFTHAMLRERIATLFDPGEPGYTVSRMTYDLPRLRLKGLLLRLPHKQRYVLTPLGRRVALSFSKSYARILRPGLARIDPDLPTDATVALARACRCIDAAIDDQIREARLAA